MRLNHQKRITMAQKTGHLWILRIWPKKNKHNRLWYQSTLEYFLYITIMFNAAFTFFIFKISTVTTGDKVVILLPLIIFKAYMFYIYRRTGKKILRGKKAARTQTYKNRIIGYSIVEIILYLISFVFIHVKT